MPDTVASLSIDITTNNRASAVLKQLEAQIVRVSKLGDSVGKGAGGGFGAGIAAPARQAQSSVLALAQAESRLLVTQGDLAGAASTLSNALSQQSTRTVQVVNAQRQLETLNQRIAGGTTGAKGAIGGLNDAIGGLTTGLGALGIAFGAAQAVQFGIDAGKSALALEQTQRVTKSLAGDTETYNTVLAAARQQQQLFGGSLNENLDGLKGLIVTARSSGAELQTLIDLSQRLSVLDPEQGTAGARVALSEALSGDPRSLAARYEIPKSALKALTDESKSAEQRLQVLDTYLNKIGITAGIAADSVSDTQKAYNELGIAADTAKTKIGALLAELAKPVAQAATSGLNQVANGLESIPTKGGKTGGDDLNAKMVANSQSYDQYVQRVQRGQQTIIQSQNQVDQVLAKNAGGAALMLLYQQMLPQVQQLTQAQFQYAQGLIQQGVSAADATAKAQQYGTAINGIAQVQANLQANMATTAAGAANLGGRLLDLATAGGPVGATAQALIVQFNAGKLSSDGLTAAVTQLEAAQIANANAAAQHAAVVSEDAVMMAQGAAITDSASAATDANTSALLANLAEKQTNEQQTRLLSDAQNTLASLAGAVNGGLLSNADAARALASQYNIAYGAALDLIRAQAALGQSDGRVAGIKGAAAGGVNGFGVSASDSQLKKIQEAKERQRQFLIATGTTAQKQQALNESLALAEKRYGKYSEEAYRARTQLAQFEDQQEKANKPKTGRGGGGGKKGGKGGGKLTEAQREAAALEKLETKTQNKLSDIDEQAQQRREQAEQDHADKVLEIRADFAEKRKQAEADLNSSLLEGDASFYETVTGMEDQDVAKKYAAMYESNKSEIDRIAREQGADVAQAYADEYEKTMTARAQREAEINKLEKEGKKSEAEAKRGVDTLKRKAEDDRLERAKSGKGSINNQEQDALTAEQTRYGEAIDGIGDKADRAASKVETAQARQQAAIQKTTQDATELGKVYDKMNGTTGASGTATTPDSTASSPTPTTTATDNPLASLLQSILDALNGNTKATSDGTGQIVGAVRSLSNAAPIG